MKFKITGADRRTGRDVVREYEANTPQAAADAANRDGLMVADAELVSGAAAPQSPLDALSYLAPTPPAGRAPTYGGLSVAGVVLRIYAIVCYTLGGLTFVVAALSLKAAIESSGSWSLFTITLAGISGFAPTLALFFVAAIAHGLSAACVALRDIARNSWR